MIIKILGAFLLISEQFLLIGFAEGGLIQIKLKLSLLPLRLEVLIL